MSFVTASSNRQASIVEMLFTGSTYTDVADWTFTLIAGSNVSGWGDTDGVLGVNTLTPVITTPPQVYRGLLRNGEPRFFFYNFWATSYGNAQNESYIRELFWNGLEWEVTTHFTTTEIFYSSPFNDVGNKFYLQNSSVDKLQYYDLNTSQLIDVADSIESSIEQERVPKTIDLINGVGFDGFSWNFDGINDYININSILPLIQNDTQGTIELWVKYSSIVNNMTILTFGRTSAVTTIGLRILSDGRFVFYYEVNGVAQWNNITTSNTSNIGKWTHLVLSQDGVNAKLYFNGEVTTSSGIDTTLWLGNQSFNVGNIGRSQNTSVGRYWVGNLSNLKYYNRPLTSEEVLQNYNANKWRFQ